MELDFDELFFKGDEPDYIHCNSFRKHRNLLGVPNMILVKLICFVNVENHFLKFTKYITFTRIMLGTPLRLR